MAEKNHTTLSWHPNANVSHAESEIAVTALASNKKPDATEKGRGNKLSPLTL